MLQVSSSNNNGRRILSSNSTSSVLSAPLDERQISQYQVNYHIKDPLSASLPSIEGCFLFADMPVDGRGASAAAAGKRVRCSADGGGSRQHPLCQVSEWKNRWKIRLEM